MLVNDEGTRSFVVLTVDQKLHTALNKITDLVEDSVVSFRGPKFYKVGNFFIITLRRESFMLAFCGVLVISEMTPM